MNEEEMLKQERTSCERKVRELPCVVEASTGSRLTFDVLDDVIGQVERGAVVLVQQARQLGVHRVRAQRLRHQRLQHHARVHHYTRAQVTIHCGHCGY